MSVYPQISIIWVDSDPNIYRSTGLFQDQNWSVICFNETADALNALRAKHLKLENIKCVITSMMERDGRRERELMNGLQIVILIGIAGPSGCGKTTYAKHLSQYLGSPIPLMSLDNFFTKPIYIDHPILGRIKSLEQPETLNISGFMSSLHQIKREWARTPFDQLNPVAEKSNPIYIVVEGFLLFALSNDVTSMFDIRIFLDFT
ncbi:unnamed protein product [Rotaria socialis]|uniref:Phosphoribulokinase/uridine kinase domain-containing protein n=1 Tax=Rotaria socialis TaxID=392032 RepID=A0A821M3Y5_9BILA|nr:unnamed protein product [Rotaria socialis]